VKVPTILFAGSADPGFLGGDMQSQKVYNAIPASTPKLLYETNGGGHWDFNTPKNLNYATGSYGLAFQKTFLEGDERYRKFLLVKGPNASDWQSNIK
jgi:predicted dienelactone hydrolase